MIRRDEHERAIRLPSLPERLQQAAQLAVDERDFSVVGRRAEPFSQIRRRRLIGRMRVVVVDPQKPRALRSGRGALWPEPTEGRARRVVRVPLDVRGAPAIVAPRQVVVVHLEPAIEAEPAIERKPRHERPGAVAALPEVFGNRAHRGGEHEPAVVAEPVPERVAAGQNRRV